MGLFEKLFGKRGPASGESPKEPEHAVIIHFMYGSTDLQSIFALEEKLEEAINSANAGEYDGNEVAVSGEDGYLYMYGPDADRLYEVVQPVLASAEFMNGAKATLRYGPPEDGVPETEKTIGA